MDYGRRTVDERLTNARVGPASFGTVADPLMARRPYGHLMPSLGRQLAVNLDEVPKRALADVDQLGPMAMVR